MFDVMHVCPIKQVCIIFEIPNLVRVTSQMTALPTTPLAFSFVLQKGQGTPPFPIGGQDFWKGSVLWFNLIFPFYLFVAGGVKFRIFFFLGSPRKN